MIRRKFQLTIPESTISGWQEILNIIAEMTNLPAALIMRLNEEFIEVFVASESKGNPYKPGDKEHFQDSGLYCEKVIKSGEKLLVPNALKDEVWKNNPDVKLDMISYLGFPIYMPDEKPFGTICVLDNKENHYTNLIESLIVKFRNMIQRDIELQYLNQLLGDENKKLTDYFFELQALRGVVPICSSCKSIRDNENKWHPIEKYFLNNPETELTHSLCPDCAKKLYPDHF